MRLDRTRIAILERNQRDLLDLSFLVLREFLLPCSLLIAILGIPLALLNYWLIEWMAADLIEGTAIARYVWTMAVLVYVEMPLASALVTSYLGRVTFYETPRAWQLLGDVARMSHRLLWTQCILRGGLLVVWMIANIPREDTFSALEAMLPFVCFVLFVWRSLRPYLNEIILLERSPLVARSPGQTTVGKRSGRLHGPNGGDLFGRGISSIPVTLSLGAAILGLLWFTVATFSNDWSWGPFMVHAVYPLALWVLALYMTVLRFLSYLDLRIRREGWEVELKMRAEAARLQERISFGNG